MTIYRFPGIRVRRTKRGRCPVCGRPAIRSRLFEQTLSPYNRHPDGTQRLEREIRADLSADAEAWVPDFTHDACADGAP